MKADVVAQYTDAESLKGLTVAVESGSTGEAAAQAAGITDLVATQDMAKALMEVKAGTADACVIDITMANAMTGEGTSYADLTYTVSLTSEEYGIGFAKGSDMPAKVNEVMKKLIANGKLDEIAAKYDLTNALISNQK
jgi:polar amino acid transport system substrate-binding protein